MNLTQLSSSDFTKIGKLLKKKEALLARVAKADKALASFGCGEPVAGPKKAKRKVSAAGRKRIAAAQRKRWAAIRKAKAGKAK